MPAEELFDKPVEKAGNQLPEPPTTEEGLRKLAVARLRKQADFRVHLLMYMAVNALLVAIWWVTGVDFFWPVFPIFGWGIGLVAHAWDAFGPDRLTETRIRAEMDRLRR